MRARHLWRTVLAAIVVALCAWSTTVAHASPEDPDGTVVVPAYGNLLGELWAQLYSLPLGENPLEGNGDPCLKVGPSVIQAVGGASCTIEQGTALTLGFGTAWSSLEEPFPQTEAEQRALALDFDQATLVEIHVIADGGERVDIRRPGFEIFSPQRTVQLPEDNILGVEAQTATLTAHAWAAVVRNLAPGQHTIVGEARLADGSTFSVSHVITVVPAG